MKITIITPDSSQKFNKNVPCIFLAGPLADARDWRKELIIQLSEYKLADELVVFSPSNDHFKTHAIQADWETKYLNYAYKNGTILFYLANKNKATLNRGYARTTRFELGEWIVKYRFGNKMKTDMIIIGMEDDFEGKEYLLHRLHSNYKINTILTNLEEVYEIIIKKLL